MSSNGLVKASRKRLINLVLVLVALVGVIAWAENTGRNASFAPQLAL
ncbi:MAG: hypothetical protein RLZZ514_625, partial [Actinomycetota bacterium]